MPGSRPERRPTGPERGRVGEVEVADLVDGEAGEQRGRVGVDAFGSLGAESADQLSAQQKSGVGVAGDADADRLRARVVALVIVGDALRALGCVASGGSFVIAQPGAGGDDVEDLDDLSADGSSESG